MSRTDVSTHTRNISRDPRIAETLRKGAWLQRLVADDQEPPHRYAKRAWGYGCRECGRMSKDAIHKPTSRVSGGPKVVTAKACLDCGGRVSRRAVRCSKCNKVRIVRAADRERDLFNLRTDAHRRGENA